MAEARGESFWTPTFSQKVRTRLLYAVGEAAGDNRVAVLERARNLILKAEGAPYLNRYGSEVTPAEDFLNHFMECGNDVMPTSIEAVYSAMTAFGYGNSNYFVPTIDVDAFGREVNQLLEDERVAFEFVRGEMRPLESKELHQQLIEPAMQLLHNSKFPAAEKAYRDALGEVTSGKPGDAITDAGTALQETLKALGCEGKNLGPLIKSARAKGLLAAHDIQMTQAIERIMEWVSADRSQKGDSHDVVTAEKDDAWFIIHVVGALIVRLVGASGR